MHDPTPSLASIPLPPPPLPEPGDPWALLLDIDGTLVEFEAHPDDVHLPLELRALLERVRLGLGGALAILSGRTLEDVDRLSAPLKFTAGALHGAEHRNPSGVVEVYRAPEAITSRIARECADAIRMWDGVFLEAKSGISFALHYRSAPGFGPAVRKLAELIVLGTDGEYEVQFGECVAELKPALPSKGSSLVALASEPPFAGRRPVVVGDDLTDETAFEQALSLGGFGVVVGSRRPTHARFALEGPIATLAWLRDLARYLEETSHR